MTLITIAPDSHAVPTRDDGTDFHVAYVCADGTTLFADTLTEVVGALIPNYPNASDGTVAAVDDDNALVARVDVLAEQAAGVQAVVAASATQNGRRFSEEELTAMFAPKDAPVTTGDWTDESASLLLLSTSYAPHTATQAPRGKFVTLLDPSTERTFLEALASITGAELFIQS